MLYDFPADIFYYIMGELDIDSLYKIMSSSKENYESIVKYDPLWEKMCFMEYGVHTSEKNIYNYFKKLSNSSLRIEIVTKLNSLRTAHNMNLTYEEYAPSSFPITIGRSRKNTFSLLYDEVVSRKHAIIEKKNGVSYWIDNGSTNPTKVYYKPFDKLRIYVITKNSEPFHIKNGMIFRIGTTKILLTYFIDRCDNKKIEN